MNVQTLIKTAKSVNTIYDRNPRSTGIRLSSQPPLIQSKLSLGAINDQYEREANRVADTVITGNQPALCQNMIENPWGVTDHLRETVDNRSIIQNRNSNAMKTECDVAVHPDDVNYYLLKKSFRTVGTGKPVIKNLVPGLKETYPCLYKTTIEHEQQHVKNSMTNCKSFKKCVDDNSSRFLGKISYEDFVKCHNKNHGGLMKDCKKDEKGAYEAQIKKAKQLMIQPECKNEKASLQKNIKYWESIKDNAPNCKTKSRKVTFQPIESVACCIARQTSQTHTEDETRIKIVPSIVHEVLASPGQPLDRGIRAYMEPHFGHDFSKVRIHADSKAVESAQAVNAQAYTLGYDVVFGAGKYHPRTNSGKRLIAHELTHTVQNNGQRLQRTVKLANTVDSFIAATYSASDVDLFYNAITGNHPNLEGFIAGTGKIYKGIGGKSLAATKRYRETLVKDILTGLLSVSTQFEYRDFKEVYDDVYKRAVASLYMRTSQGTLRVQKVRYPRTVGRKANRKASVYWTISTDVSGHYRFDLNSNGLDNAYEALRSILFDGTGRADTTRMHCDYVIAAIHFMTMAEDMGIAVFDQAVKDGNIKVWLLVSRPFDPTLPESMTVWGGTGTTPVAVDLSKKSLGNYYASGESELIVGDHLMFYNHSAYNALNKRQGESWKLENAFVTDKKGAGGRFRFQGHGYYSPKERSSFISAMKGKFNTLSNRAKTLISAGNTSELASKFPFVKLKSGVTSSTSTSDHEVVYSKKGDDGRSWTGWSSIPVGDRLFMTLRSLTDADYPNPFARWGETKESAPAGTARFTVWRPAEGLKD